jgi:hypothetical protein
MKTKKKPEMIGAHVPKPLKHRRRFQQETSAKQFNDAYDTWAQKQGRTHLVRTRDFAH